MTNPFKATVTPTSNMTRVPNLGMNEQGKDPQQHSPGSRPH